MVIRQIKSIVGSMVFLLSIILISLFSSSIGVGQTSQTRNQIEFRELHPDARRLLVDELRLQVSAEQDKRLKSLVENLEIWLRIGSGAIGVIVGLLALVGWRGLSSIRQNLRQDIVSFVRSNAEFSKEINDRIEVLSKSAANSLLEKSRREINLARLELLSRKVEQSESYTDDEKSSMIELLVSMRDDGDIIKTHAFYSTANSVLMSLINAGLDASVDDLDRVFSDVFQHNRQLSIRLMHHYGERSIEDATTRPANPDTQLASRYAFYLDAVKRNKMSEIAIYYRCLVAFARKAKGWEKEIAGICKEIRFITPSEKEWLSKQFVRLEDVKEEDHERHRELAEAEAQKGFWSECGESVATALAVRGPANEVKRS